MAKRRPVGRPAANRKRAGKQRDVSGVVLQALLIVCALGSAATLLWPELAADSSTTASHERAGGVALAFSVLTLVGLWHWKAGQATRRVEDEVRAASRRLESEIRAAALASNPRRPAETVGGTSDEKLNRIRAIMRGTFKTPSKPDPGAMNRPDSA